MDLDGLGPLYHRGYLEIRLAGPEVSPYRHGKQTVPLWEGGSALGQCKPAEHISTVSTYHRTER